MKAAIDLLGAGVKIAQEGYEVAAPVIKQGVDVVAPVVSEAVKVTAETAAPLLQKATPVVKVCAVWQLPQATDPIEHDSWSTAVAAGPCSIFSKLLEVVPCSTDAHALIHVIPAL